MKKILLSLVVLVIFGGIFNGYTFAHPGRTDTYWWHICRTNCKKRWLRYGQYHYHYRYR